MRRLALAVSLLSLVVGLGCKHIGGKNDVYHDPSNAELPAGTGGNAYPTLGGPIIGSPVPEKLAAPEKMPEKAK